VQSIGGSNRAQGPDRRSAGAENQDFQLRTRLRRVPATATAHISATTHFFANFRENQYKIDFFNNYACSAAFQHLH